jgi:cephalosporin-C deacetylase-like acetyl esterase
MGVVVTLTNDGGKELVESKTYEIGATPQTIEYELQTPGFARLTAIGRSWQGKMTYVKTFSVAACDPEKIVPAVTMPEDFDAFWQKARARLAEISVDVKQEKIDSLCNEKHDTFKVSFANINGTRAYGYLLVPKTGKDKYPGFIAIAPAGVGKPKESFVDGRMNNISKDEAICLYMSVYDHDLGQPEEFYKNYKSNDDGMESDDLEKSFFYRSILGIDRAITWLASREDIDKEHIVYTGNSQGGGMGIILTGLNKNITAANVNIPALCDHLGFLAERQSGWPGILGGRNAKSKDQEKIEALKKTLPYFDAVNFARKITVPVLLTMGFIDTTCPPSGVYSAYNVISSSKQIFCDPNAGHGVSKKMMDAIVPWIQKNLGGAEHRR